MSIKPWLITLLAFASALASPLSANPRQDEIFLDAGRRQVEFAATAEPHRSSGGACAAIAAECLVAPKGVKGKDVPEKGFSDPTEAGRREHQPGKPGRKKQGREPGEKKRQKPGWTPRNPPKEPPPHTPSRKT